MKGKIIAIVIICSAVFLAFDLYLEKEEIISSLRTRIWILEKANEMSLKEREDSITLFKGEIEDLEDEKSQIKAKYNSVIERNKKTKVVLKPTYEEMKDFLKEDKTDNKAWTKNEYMCCDFSADVIRNAKEKGILVHLVMLTYEDVSERGYNLQHCLVAFNTTDRGLIFIEPQTDGERKVEVGKIYSDNVIRRYKIFG